MPPAVTGSALLLPVPAFPSLRERLVVCFLSGVRSKLSSSSAEGWGEGRGTQKLGSSTSIVSTSAPLDQHRVRVKIPPTFFNPELGFNWNVAVALGNKQLNTEQHVYSTETKHRVPQKPSAEGNRGIPVKNKA